VYKHSSATNPAHNSDYNWTQSQEEPCKSGPAASPTGKKPSGWFRYGNMRVEAAVFLLIAMTFAAVLNHEAVTGRQFDIMARAGQYFPFNFSDGEAGGASSVTATKGKPFAWTCTLREGAQYLYCGSGIQFAGQGQDASVDFAKYSEVTIHLDYRGTGDHLRVLLQSTAQSTFGGALKKGETIPYVAEIAVVQGANEIHIGRDAFMVEPWWLTAHHLTADQVGTAMDHIVSFAFSSPPQTPTGRFDVSVTRAEFHGVTVSTAQWYLILLGVWLVLTGGFLVFRFLNMRKVYEARQGRQLAEARVLGNARASAEAASEAKSQFLANMSHELRTPLNAIIGYAQLIKDNQSSARDRAAVQTIEQSGEHLLLMISDILDIAKVESGHLELLSNAFDLKACVQSVTQMVRLRAEEKGLAFTVSLGTQVPLRIMGDQKRLRQVLINVIGNAIKFTPSGQVSLTVDLDTSIASRPRLKVVISDSGVGIEETNLDRIFRPFEQAGNAIDRSGGTGLGLSITHKIVEMMGGEITVSSEVGVGSTFTISLPFEAPTAESEDLLTTAETILDFGSAQTMAGPPPTQPAQEVGEMVAPSTIILERLLGYARAGNLRAIRREIPDIIAGGKQFEPFAERLDELAARYQSPAVLRLIEKYTEQSKVA
jgi:signal transduction histidine kinase